MQIEILPNRKCIRENNKIISRNNKQPGLPEQRQPLAKQTQKIRPNHNATGGNPNPQPSNGSIRQQQQLPSHAGSDAAIRPTKALKIVKEHAADRRQWGRSIPKWEKKKIKAGLKNIFKTIQTWVKNNSIKNCIQANCF